MLTDKYKTVHMATCQEKFTRDDNMNGALFSSIVTMDETWLSFFNPEMKLQLTQWMHTNSPPPQPAKKYWIITVLRNIPHFQVCVHMPHGKPTLEVLYLALDWWSSLTIYFTHAILLSDLLVHGGGSFGSLSYDQLPLNSLTRECTFFTSITLSPHISLNC